MGWERVGVCVCGGVDCAEWRLWSLSHTRKEYGLLLFGRGLAEERYRGTGDRWLSFPESVPIT